MIETVHEKPPIYERCHKQFGVNWDDGIIFTYGDKIYCKYDIPEHFWIHEKTHITQQTDMGKDIWWERYFKDKDFRLSQELAAYKTQIEYIKENFNRQQRREMERQIYKAMAEFYGGMCTEKEAKKLLE